MYGRGARKLQIPATDAISLLQSLSEDFLTRSAKFRDSTLWLYIGGFRTGRFWTATSKAPIHAVKFKPNYLSVPKPLLRIASNMSTENDR